MNRLRLADVRTPIARVLGECTTSTRVRDIANEAHRRLVPKGPWLGTRQRYQICVSNTGCISWPRQIETIEGYWLCDCPGTIRNGWWEANVNGPGLQDSDNSLQHTLIDRGTAAVFDQPDGIVSKIQVYSAVVETGTKRILIRGYDHNDQWVRTQDSGVWIDGEYVTISNVAQLTTNKYTAITEAIKDATSGPVYLWQYDTTTGLVTKQLAYYEPDETLPIYRQSLIPGLGDLSGCGCSSDSDTTCTSNKITVIARLKHIDVVNENDFFLLGNLAALKLMAQAVLKEERNLFDESMAYEAKAVKELQDELAAFEGEGVIATVRTEDPDIWGGGVQNTIGLGAWRR